MIKILLKNCRLIDEKETQNILIEKGKIVQIGKNISYDGEIIDIAGKIVMPGIIDAHVHFRDFELSHKEDFESGSYAAVAGGVTTFIDMPNTKPATITNELLEEKRELAKKSVANYGFHFGISPKTDIKELELAINNNVASTKIFLNSSTGNLFIEDYDILNSVFSKSKIVSTHAEGRKKVKLAIELAKKNNIPVYLCHISQKSELDEIQKCGYDKVYVEVSPHHLFLTEKDADKFNIMKPELRPVEDQDALWQAIKDGHVHTIGTDHAPHLKSEKEAGEIYGVTGIESMIPLLLDAYNKGRITLEKIQELCCSNPAKIFGIQKKGELKVGYDADLTIIDIDKVQEVKNEELKTKAGWTPYEGMSLKGWPVMTFVNGNLVYDNGKINNKIKGKEVEFKK